MKFIESLQKHLPLLIATSVVVAFIYLEGFFVQANSSLMHLLSYSDILISIAFMVPVISTLLLLYQAISGNVDGIYVSNKVWINVVTGIVAVGFSSVVIWYAGVSYLIGYVAVIFIILAKPIKDYIKIFIVDENEKISLIYIFLAILACSYAKGYSDYSNAAYGELSYNIVESDDFENCRLIRVFSDIVLLGNGNPRELLVVPNNKVLKITKVLALPKFAIPLTPCTKKTP